MMSASRMRLSLLLVSLMLAVGAFANDAAELDRVFQRSTLQIATPDARVHRFRIWIADDDARRARGLMFVKQLEDDQGMLFIYPSERIISMWMKNTYIPLDMVFFEASGKIVHVVSNTEPMSLESIESKYPASAVLELKAGTAARLKIAPGARVILP